MSAAEKAPPPQEDHTGYARQEWRTARRLSVFLITALFVVALAGRFSLDNGDKSSYIPSDLRVVGCLLLLVGALFWLPRPEERQPGRRTIPASLVLACALIGLQLLSAFWSPPGARTGQVVWDLTALLILVFATAVVARIDPARAARVMLGLALLAAIVYALAALAAGPQIEGRYSAFGGGPNVFVRVICMGVIASVTLAARGRRWPLLVPLPLLLLAAALSGSRGGLLALAVSLVAFIILFAKRRRIAYLAGTAFAGALLTFLAWMFFRPLLAPLIENRYSASGLERGDFSTRPQLLRSAWSLFLDHPLIGNGLDAFYATFGIGYPHNYLAALASEGGIVAVGLAGIVAVQWWRDGRPWSSVSLEQKACAVIAIYVATASQFSGDYYDTRFMWIFGALAVLPQPARHDDLAIRT
jgi:O-antigen ligase